MGPSLFRCAVVLVYSLMATNVLGVLQGCRCVEHHLGHRHVAAGVQETHTAPAPQKAGRNEKTASSAAAALSHAPGAKCTSLDRKANHVGIQNWEFYLPSPDVVIDHPGAGRPVPPQPPVMTAVSLSPPGKIPI